MKIHHVENVSNCHVFASGKAEGSHYISVATENQIVVFRYNEKAKKFAKKWVSEVLK